MHFCDPQPPPSDLADQTRLWSRHGAAVGPVDPAPARVPGAVLDDRYRLVALLKRGGMAEIYAAEHVVTRRRSAVKLLRPCWHHDAEMGLRFRREAQAIARVTHPNIVEVLDFGVDSDGFGYLVMELLYGEDLQATLRREGRLSLARATDIVFQLCAALTAAHAAGLVHRDLKPANCFRAGFRDVEDYIKLVDFGIAHQRPPTAGDAEAPLTRAGMVLGTVYYMPPEQAAGDAIDHRVDVYATGVLLYQLITGALPFRGDTPAETMRRIHADDMPALRTAAPDLVAPAALEAILRTALAKRPESRFQSMAELAAALAGLRAVDFRDRPPVRRATSPAWLMVAAPLVLACGVAAALI